MGAFGGKKEIMDHLAPDGPVYQAGTLSGNPIAMAIGCETVSILNEGGVYEALEEKSKRLEDGIRENLQKLKLNFTLNRSGSMFCLFFTEQKVDTYQSGMTSDSRLFRVYFKNMLGNGIYIAPSPYEVSFLSTAHTDKDVDQTIKANYASLKNIISAGKG